MHVQIPFLRRSLAPPRPVVVGPPRVPGGRRLGQYVGVGVALIVIGTRCADAPLVAPDDAVVEILVAPTELAADGDTAMVSVLLSEKAGGPVEDGTRVVLTASGGTLCPVVESYPWPARPSAAPPSCASRADGVWPAAVELTTRAGVASALVRSGAAPGTLTLRARSGSASLEKTLQMVATVAPEGATAVMTAWPADVAIGATSVVTAFLTQKSGAPVTDGTRVVFTPVGGTVSQAVVLTQKGFATTRFTGTTAGAGSVRFVSGLLADTVAITVH